MNDSLIYKFFEHNRNAEVAFRLFVDKHKKIKDFATGIFNHDKFRNMELSVKEGQWDLFKKIIVDNGITKGDIVLVHSSMVGLSTLGVSPEEIFDFLETIVGIDGTVVFPVYPDLKKMDSKEGAYIYDPKTTVPWTGRLPREFLKREGVHRSEFPHNTLAAIGKYAIPMTDENTKKGQMYSQGKNSSWEYGVNHGMKILYLGVNAATSCTIVHYAEDQLASEWPVNKWYKEHDYLIKEADGTFYPFRTKERNDEWFRYYGMFSTGYELKKKGYLREYDADGVYIGIMDQVKDMCNYLICNAKEGNILFGIPKKYILNNKEGK